MSRRFSTLAATALAAALTLVALGAVPASASEGCTPGYWKQPQHADSWQGVSPTDRFNTVFSVNWSLTSGLSLLDVLWLQGEKTGVHKLAAHSTAALLNYYALGGTYHYNTPGGLQSLVQSIDITDKGEVTSQAYWFDYYNNFGCPLN